MQEAGGGRVRGAGYGMRVAGCGLRVAGYGLRVAGYEVRVCGLRGAESRSAALDERFTIGALRLREKNWYGATSGPEGNTPVSGSERGGIAQRVME